MFPGIARVPIIMPQLGESIAEATVVRLPFAVGDQVEGDAEIIEVETNKATMGVTAPCSGRVAELLVELQQSYPVGATLGWLEVSEDEAARLGLDVATPAPTDASTDTVPTSSTPATHVARATVEPTVRGLPVPAHAAGASYLSPRLKARMNELGMHAADLSGVAGSGAAGRVTVEDFEKFIKTLNEHRMSPASTMRVAVADAMRRSWTRPLATVGMSVSIEAAPRASAKPPTRKPGPALYALRALGYRPRRK